MILQSASELTYTPSRIVSLVPSQTELLHFLGLEDTTIAITKFCVHPADWLKSKIIIGGTKNIRIAEVKNLHPDLIVANREENTKEQVEELAKNYPVWLTDINNLPDAIQMIKDLGELTGTSDKAAELIGNISSEFLKIRIQKPAIPTAYLIWYDPLMTIGGDTFINDILTRCGFNNIFGDKTRYPTVSIEDIRKAGCRLLILSSEPYPFNKHHMKYLKELLPGTKIIFADGEIFSWYGSRLLKAPAYINQLLL